MFVAFQCPTEYGCTFSSTWQAVRLRISVNSNAHWHSAMLHFGLNYRLGTHLSRTRDQQSTSEFTIFLLTFFVFINITSNGVIVSRKLENSSVTSSTNSNSCDWCTRPIRTPTQHIIQNQYWSLQAQCLHFTPHNKFTPHYSQQVNSKLSNSIHNYKQKCVHAEYSTCMYNHTPSCDFLYLALMLGLDYIIKEYNSSLHNCNVATVDCSYILQLLQSNHHEAV